MTRAALIFAARLLALLLSLALIPAVIVMAPSRAWAPPPRAMTVRHVDGAAARHGLEAVDLYALWAQECSLRAVCEAGDMGVAFGPFQITAARARDHGCRGGWAQGEANAECAARIIADERGASGSLLRAYTRYQCPACWERYGNRPTSYAQQVYGRRLLLKVGAVVA